MNNVHVNTKKPLNDNLKNYSLRVKYKIKYCFYLILFIALFISLFTPNDVAQLLKAVATGQYLHFQAGASPSFSFTAGGDIGGNKDSATTLGLIATSSSNFYIALGDLSYSEITPESAWCAYVQSYVGSTFPFELISGNH